MKIILMSNKHIKTVAELFSQAFGPEELGEPWTIENSRKHIKENYSKGSSWVVIEDGKLVGALISSSATFEKGTELLIDTIVVETNYRKQGVGTKLMKVAVRFAKKNNLVGVRLLSNPQLASYNWYKSLGFHDSGWKEQVLFFA